MMEPKIDGLKVMIGGQEYIIPPLNFRQLKTLYPLIEQMQNEQDIVKRMEAVVTLAHAALSRNYEITIETVEEMIDLGNLKMLIDAVMGASGFLRGETLAGSDPTGMKSMPT